jgi:hypothetical protein
MVGNQEQWQYKMAPYSNTPSDWPLRPIPEFAMISGFAPLALAGRSSH